MFCLLFCWICDLLLLLFHLLVFVMLDLPFLLFCLHAFLHVFVDVFSFSRFTELAWVRRC